MNRSDVEKLMKAHGKGSKLTLELDGKTYPALIKELQYNPLKGQFDEIDFQALVADEMVRSVAEVQIHNHDKLRAGLLLQQELTEISYSAFPSDLIEKVIIDAEPLNLGDTITVGDLEIAKNPKIHLHTDTQAVVVTVSVAKSHEDSTEETEETPSEETTQE